MLNCWPTAMSFFVDSSDILTMVPTFSGSLNLLFLFFLLLFAYSPVVFKTRLNCKKQK